MFGKMPSNKKTLTGISDETFSFGFRHPFRTQLDEVPEKARAHPQDTKMSPPTTAEKPHVKLANAAL